MTKLKQTTIKRERETEERERERERNIIEREREGESLHLSTDFRTKDDVHDLFHGVLTCRKSPRNRGEGLWMKS